MIGRRSGILAIAAAMVLLSFAIPPTQAAAVIQLTPLVSPTSLTPGGTGSLSLVLRNVGNVSAFNMQTNIVSVDDEVDVDQTGVVYIGGLGALETTTLTPFTFAVARNATPGLYRIDGSLTLRYFEGGTSTFNSFEYSAVINVRAAENLAVHSIVPDRLEPGEETAAVFRIANNGPSEYVNVAGSWSTLQNIILPLGGSNQFQIASVPANTVVDVPVKLAASAGATPGLQAMTFQLRYLDVAGNPHNSTSTVGIWLGGGTASELSVNIQNITDDEVTLAVTNVGLKPVTGVQVRLVPLSGFSLDDSDTVVVGNLAAGEFRTATFDINRLGGVADARAEVAYTDSLGQRRSSTEPLAVGDGAVATESSEVLVGVLTAVAILGVQGVILVFWLMHRRTVRRREAKETKDEADFAELAKDVRDDTENNLR